MNPLVYHYSAVLIFLGVLAVFWYLGKFPQMDSVQRLAALLDTKGGNIIVLSVLALYFFHDAQSMYYAVMDKIKDGTIATDNGIALNGLTFATGAFSAISGALLKVMSGTEPPQVNGPGKVVTTATTTVEKTGADTNPTTPQPPTTPPSVNP